MFPALLLFFKSFIMGLSVSAPPGPNAMLMINRTLRKGHFSGFMTGMGVAAADTIFAIIAGLGFSFIIGFINEEAFWIKLVAGVLVASIGLKLFLSNPVGDIRRRARDDTQGTPAQDFFSVFGLALTNPFSIFIFLAMFPGMNVSFTGPWYLIPLIIVTGIFTGASAWWLAFSYTVSRLSRTMRLRNIVVLTRFTGAFIIIIGLMVLLTLFISVRY
jgi:threonine/homoserine/homoserine lactone efflux protein